ncbi:hypothetical protein PYCC9005_001498 [Savitreella phatthalungensis]
MSTPIVAPFSQANRSRVASLYKRSLKLARDWLIHRDSWRRQAMLIRERFEQNRDVHDPRLLNDIFAKTEAELLKYKHPHPYIVPTAPGGSKWERNIPPKLADGPVEQREVD